MPVCAAKRNPAIRVLLLTQQPFVAAGARTLIHASKGFVLTECCDSLETTAECVKTSAPDIVLVHVTWCMSLPDLGRLCVPGAQWRVVLWGDGFTGEFAYQAMLLGVRAILPGNTAVEGLLTSLADVHRGVLCFEKELIDRMLLKKRVTLTKREGQIVSLVAQGLKNKAIGGVLGITEGTVKVYLYKLFKKLGVNDRLDMALYSWKNLIAGEGGIPESPLRVGMGPHGADGMRPSESFSSLIC